MAPSSVWLLGASISVAAQFVSMLGTVLMRGKSSATRLTSSYPRAAAAFDTANTSRIAWVAGVLCVVIGTVADFVALSITPQSIIAALGCLTLVAEVLWAPLFLGDILGCAHYVGCILILTGEALALSFGPHVSPSSSTTAISSALVSSSFLLFVIGIGALATCVCVASAAAEPRFAHQSRWQARPTTHDAEAIIGAKPSKSLLSLAHRHLNGILAGLLGALTLTVAKGLGELLLLGLGWLPHAGGDGSPWAAPILWLGAPAALAGVLVQARLLHAGVSRYGGGAVLPAHQTAWTLGVAAGGLLVWGDAAALEDQAAAPQGAPPIVPALGIALVLVGVWVICDAASERDYLHKAAAVGSPRSLQYHPPGDDWGGEINWVGSGREATAAQGTAIGKACDDVDTDSAIAAALDFSDDERPADGQLQPRGDEKAARGRRTREETPAQPQVDATAVAHPQNRDHALGAGSTSSDSRALDTRRSAEAPDVNLASSQPVVVSVPRHQCTQGGPDFYESALPL